MRREFAPESRDDTVGLTINTGRATAVVARELGIVEQTLGNWVNATHCRQTPSSLATATLAVQTGSGQQG